MVKVENRSVYSCPDCKYYYELLYTDCDCTPTCCGTQMEKLNPKKDDYTTEKHVPYIEKVDGGVLVKVGKETDHPMTEEHYIAYIEIYADDMLMRKYLNPGDSPEAFFKTDAKVITARELCNIHKLWESNQ